MVKKPIKRAVEEDALDHAFSDEFSDDDMNAQGIDNNESAWSEDYSNDNLIDEQEYENTNKETGKKAGLEETTNMKNRLVRKETKSTYEKSQERMASMVAELEAENLRGKKWIMLGEVSGRHRPMNSLLEEVVDFDQTWKPLPLITEEVTESIESLIKRRIEASQWDDPIPFEPSKPLTLTESLPEVSQVKSTQSLSMLYEADYKHQTMNISETDPHATAKKTIEEQWKKIEYQLNSLTHFHYLPKPNKEKERAEVAHLPSLMLEEATPCYVSTRSTLAPQEIFSPSKTPLKAASELSREERHAQHLRKKKSQKQQGNEAEIPNPSLHPGSKHAEKKKEKEKARILLSTQKNVTLLPDRKATTKSRKKPKQR